MAPETQLHQTRIKYSNVASENQKWQSQKISDYVLQRRFARGRGDGRVMVNIITMAGPGRWVLREGDGHLDPPSPRVSGRHVAHHWLPTRGSTDTLTSHTQLPID